MCFPLQRNSKKKLMALPDHLSPPLSRPQDMRAMGILDDETMASTTAISSPADHFDAPLSNSGSATGGGVHSLSAFKSACRAAVL